MLTNMYIHMYILDMITLLITRRSGGRLLLRITVLQIFIGSPADGLWILPAFLNVLVLEYFSPTLNYTYLNYVMFRASYGPFSSKQTLSGRLASSLGQPGSPATSKKADGPGYNRLMLADVSAHLGKTEEHKKSLCFVS